MNIGLMIKEARLAKGYTLDDLSKIIGVTAATVSRWENGKIEDMKRSKIKALSDALDIPPYIIMGWDAPHGDKEISAEDRDLLNAYHAATDEQRRLVLYALGFAEIVVKGV